MARTLHWLAAVGAASRMEELGPESLSEAELLAVLLGGGDAGEIEKTAQHLLADGLPALRSVRAVASSSSGGLTRALAHRLVAALELGRRVALAEARDRRRLLHAGELASVLSPRLAHLDHEEFWAVLLTARLEEIRSVRISIGGITHCSVLPREAFAPALIHAAPCVAFAHNHPSGDPRPSSGDRRVERLLEEAGRALGVHVVDQLVITSRGHHSAREGFLSFCGEPAPEHTPQPSLETDGFPIAFTEEDKVCPKPQ